MYETRLTDTLLDEDPQSAVADLLVEVTTLFQSERYNVVLPKESDKIKCDAKAMADDLIARSSQFWSLKVKPHRLPPKPRSAPGTGSAGTSEGS